MLTAAKLVGGVLLACTATYVTYLFLPLTLADEKGLYYYAASALLGLIVGWRSIGFDPGFGGIGSIVAGLRGVVVLVFLSAVVWGGWVVIAKLMAFYIKYFSSIVNVWITSVAGFITLLVDPRIILSLLIGGCLSGIGAGLANKYWT